MSDKVKKTKYSFHDFFDIDEIQKIQDLFSKATGVASIITAPDGVPITEESGFSNFCMKVRKTEQGLCNCIKSDSIIGNPDKDGGPRIQKCLSGGLYDGGTSIMVGGQHIANWLVGQVIDESVDPATIIEYAINVGLDEKEIKKDIDDITHMSLAKFTDICNFLYHNAQLLSKMGLDNLQMKQEIEKRNEIEKKLEKEKELFQVTIASIGEGIITTDKEGNITFMNSVAEDITGWKLTETQDISLYDIVFMKEDLQEEGRKTVEDLFLSDQCSHFLKHTELICKDGAVKSIENSVATIKDHNDEIQGLVLIIRDITKEKKLQWALEARELMHRAMISNISDVISIIDEKGIVQYQSENSEKIFGWDANDIVGNSALQVVHPEELEYIQGQFEDLLKKPGTTKVARLRIMSKDLKYKDIHIHATNLLKDPIIKGVLLNYKDITDTVLLEKEKEQTDAWLRNQQKFDSIGTLAGGVAHEINNPINGIMNYSQLILEAKDNDEDTYEYAKEIIHETKRVATIVKNLLQFSRHESGIIASVKINDVIEETLSLIRTIIKHDQITLKVDTFDDIPEVKCKSQQIQQVLMNLMTNARDALNEKYEGYDENKKLIVSSEVYQQKNKSWARITIEDHGMGIKKDIQDKIFDPFFTTKGRTEGTGIGLSISYRIVKEHNGNLLFDTKQGEYTKFYIDLPIVTSRRKRA